MTPYKQLFRHNIEENVIGDCWRTAIGCLLDKRPEDVPHFVEEHWGDPETAMRLTREWLKTQGYGYIEIPYNAPNLQGILDTINAINPGVYYLLGGNSRNGTGHSVVALNDKIVFDPALDNSGIVGPMDDGFYWIGFLVPAIILKD